MCMCVCVYACMCVCEYVCVSTGVSVSVHVRVCACASSCEQGKEKSGRVCERAGERTSACAGLTERESTQTGLIEGVRER